MSKDVIKDCPFCGAKASDGTVVLDEIEIGIWAVVCNGCKAIGPHRDGKQDQEQAEHRWNRLRGVS